MHDRNVLSLVKDFAGFALVSLASLVAAPVHGRQQPTAVSGDAGALVFHER